MRLMSIRLAGRASRKFIAGTRLCPPARIFPSWPCVARRSSASSTVRGAKYLNETGFISDKQRPNNFLLFTLNDLPDKSSGKSEATAGASSGNGSRAGCPLSWPISCLPRWAYCDARPVDFPGYEREEICDDPVHLDETHTIGRRRRSTCDALRVVEAGACRPPGRRTQSGR